MGRPAETLFSAVWQAIIRYYAREKYYHHIQQLVLECEQKSGADSELTFWRAYSLAMESKR